MDAPDFIVVFAGKALEGFDPMTVQIAVEGALRLTEAQSEKFFSGKPVAIKRSPDKAAALKIAQQLKSLGADVSVRVDKKDRAPAGATEAGSENVQPAPAGDKAADSAPENGLSLKDNIGFLFDPAADPIPPPLDLSGFSIAGTGNLLTADEQKQVAPLELDLSTISIKENDGSTLVEPGPEVTASVTVPDLDLDEAGAILETIGGPEPVAEPDLSAWSLKTSEGDLIDAHERAPSIQIEVDTSQLKLSAELSPSASQEKHAATNPHSAKK